MARGVGLIQGYATTEDLVLDAEIREAGPCDDLLPIPLYAAERDGSRYDPVQVTAEGSGRIIEPTPVANLH